MTQTQIANNPSLFQKYGIRDKSEVWNQPNHDAELNAITIADNLSELSYNGVRYPYLILQSIVPGVVHVYYGIQKPSLMHYTIVIFETYYHLEEFKKLPVSLLISNNKQTDGSENCQSTAG